MAFRVSLVFARKLLLPASCYMEGALCKEVVDDHYAVFKYGSIATTGNAWSVEEFRGKASIRYPKEESRIRAYSERKIERMPPFVKRGRSATKSLHKSWQRLSQQEDPAKMFARHDKELARIIERRWDNVVRDLGHEGMIAENVKRVMLDGQGTRDEKGLLDKFRIFLADEYYADIAEEFGAHVIWDVPYMANYLRWGTFPRRLHFSSCVEALGVLRIKQLAACKKENLPELIESLRYDLLSEDLVVFDT